MRERGREGGREGGKERGEIHVGLKRKREKNEGD